MTSEALELLATGLKSFMEQKEFLDDAAFDEISKEARFLSNHKLYERCKITKRRCGDTRNLLNARCAVVANRQQELVAAEMYPSTADGYNSKTCNQCGGDEAACSQQWRQRSSQSAPPTPALALKCSENRDLNRRSQSLEDDIASEVLHHIYTNQWSAERADNNELVLPIKDQTSTISNTADYVQTSDSFGTVRDLISPVHTAKADITETILNCERVNIEETITIYDQQLIDQSSIEPMDTATGRLSPETNTQSDVESCEARIIHDNPSKYFHHCHTVYRGETILEPTADITIPLEDSCHSNNNNLVIKSPTIEDGHIIYAPRAKPRPVKRLTLSSSTESDIVHVDSPGDGTPRASFSMDDDDDDSSAIDFSSTSTLVTLQNNLGFQCKLSPVLSLKQKQKAMQKRRSFHGFTSALTAPILNFAKNWRTAEESAKRLSIPEHEIASEDIAMLSSRPAADLSMTDHLNQIECSLEERDVSRLLKLKRMNKTMSLVTGSSDSLPRSVFPLRTFNLACVVGMGCKTIYTALHDNNYQYQQVVLNYLSFSF